MFQRQPSSGGGNVVEAPRREVEVEHVVERMVAAGWPTPVQVGADEEARDQWAAILDRLAAVYLRSTRRRVDALVALGPLAAGDLAGALDLASWEGLDLFAITDRKDASS